MKKEVKEVEDIEEEKDDGKFDTKDKITGVILIVIIIILIMILAKIIKKDNLLQNNKNTETIFEVNVKTKEYSPLMSSTKGVQLELKCDPLEKVNITITKGRLFNDNETLAALGENNYTLTCSKEQIIYWSPTNDIEESETIRLNFKSENEKLEEKNINIQKQENAKYIVID